LKSSLRIGSEGFSREEPLSLTLSPSNGAREKEVGTGRSLEDLDGCRLFFAKLRGLVRSGGFRREEPLSLALSPLGGARE
jgi:hypothetical protein